MLPPKLSSSPVFSDTEYHAQPSIRPGMWASVSSKYQPYKCVSHFECPGGPAGQCAARRTGTACTLCEEGYFRFNGACRECSPSHRLTLIAVLVLMAAFCYATYHMTGGSTMLHQVTTLLGVTMSLGHIIKYLQLMALFGLILFEWHISSIDDNSWSSLLKALRLALFDFTEVLSLDCWANGISPLASYTIRMLIPVFLYGSSVIASSVALDGGTHYEWEHLSLANSIGQITQALFIPIVVSSLAPLQCFSHPSRDAQSVLQYPEQLCEGGEYWAMVGIGIAGLLIYVIGFVCLVFWATLWVGELCETDPSYMKRFRFLFYRFRQDRYYWSTIIVTQNMALSLVPFIKVDDMYVK
ncbi:hypothetical protein Pmar_PMAR010035 [Perkinsus marinus ATCC 50983]|uniref:Uncharacterized protein n=1 Tax=Perkinsus marinus (strain ATCC 50983 / TXsc) TaxID=423536 RepID=C5K4M9_PERM5|nr:hypothetical protein Pmar_PMAR010035 [Perkinsus marinus ATCC 50983]EER20301.1 hypothetical protein Pmar_PMAR010035 [Perkinsus marinus ATCC 50983]|eukprot:XP_002788505.1 hypothetical protein Pmar_PMAR010035 [Perkinsus marinus ATCC 50983]